MVTIYSTPTCVYCQAAKAYFKEHNIEYSEKDVAQDTAARQEMVEKTGQMGVPVIEVNGEIMVGWNQQHFQELLQK